VADPNLQKRRGPGHPDPEIKRRPGINFFWPFGPFGVEIKEEPGPPGPSPGSATVK